MLDEHLGYIADRIRLERYQQAISATLTSGLTPGAIPAASVIDAGCGFGVLGLLCLQSGAGHVWGIDETAAIDVARETLDRAGLGDRYTCIRAQSFRAAVPEPVDLIICDHVGYFGFDYGIIAMIGDLRRRLLKPGGTVMPRRIRLITAGAASENCRSKAEGWHAEGVPADFHWLRQYGVNTKHACKFKPEDIVTAPAALGEIDLTVDSPEHFAFKATITALHDGTLDGLAGWFECELAESVWMTNSPLAEDKIHRGQVFLPFDQPLAVLVGDAIEVSISLRHDSGTIVWSAHVPRSGQRQKQSNWNSLVLDPAALNTSPDRVPQLTGQAQARALLLGLIDGQRTAAEIEQAMLRDHPGMLPSAEAMSRFVRDELARNTACGTTSGA
ncbi:MAG: class I SAM-dependent methyltransferase [Novosphingobium sp.]